MDDQRAFLVEPAGRANVEIRMIPAHTELPPINPFSLVPGTPPVVVEPSRLALRYAFNPGTVAHFEVCPTVAVNGDMGGRALD